MTSLPFLCSNEKSQEEHLCGKNNVRKSDTALAVAQPAPRRLAKHSLSWPSTQFSKKGDRLSRTSKSFKNTDSPNLNTNISRKNNYSSNTAIGTLASSEECFTASLSSHILLTVNRSPSTSSECAESPCIICENNSRKEIISTSGDEPGTEDTITNLRSRSATKAIYSTLRERFLVEVADFGCQVPSEHDRLGQQSAKATQVNMYVPETLPGQNVQSNSTVFSPGQYFTTADPSPVCGSQKYINLKYSVHTYSDQILVHPKELTLSRLSSDEDLPRSISMKWRISRNGENSKVAPTLGTATLIPQDHTADQSLEGLKQDSLMRPSYENTDVVSLDYLAQSPPVGKLREPTSSTNTGTVFGIGNTCEKSLKTRQCISNTGKIVEKILRNGKQAPSVQSTTKEIGANVGSSMLNVQQHGVKLERSLGSKWSDFPNEQLPAHEVVVEFPLPPRPGVKSNYSTTSSTQSSRRYGFRSGPVKPGPSSLKPSARPSQNLAAPRDPRVNPSKSKHILTKQVLQSSNRLIEQTRQTSRRINPPRSCNSRACSADVSRIRSRTQRTETAHFREWHGDVESEKATLAINRDVTLQRVSRGTSQATTASSSLTLWRGFLHAFRSAFSTPSSFLHGCGTGCGSQVDAPDYLRFSQQNHGINGRWRRAKSLSDINDHSLSNLCQRSVSDLQPQALSPDLAISAVCHSPPRKTSLSIGQLKQQTRHSLSSSTDKSFERTSLNRLSRLGPNFRGPASFSRVGASSTNNVKLPTRSFSPEALARKRATSLRPSLCSLGIIQKLSLTDRAVNLAKRVNISAEKRQLQVGNPVQFRDVSTDTLAD